MSSCTICQGVSNKGVKCSKPTAIEQYCTQHWKKYNHILPDVGISQSIIDRVIQERNKLKEVQENKDRLSDFCKDTKNIYQLDIESREITNKFVSIDNIVLKYNNFSKFGLWKALNTNKRIYQASVWIYEDDYNKMEINDIFKIGYNNTILRSPKLIKQWDYELNETDISDIQVSSDVEVWWKCNNPEHGSYKRSLHQRFYKETSVTGTGCLKCIHDSYRVNDKEEKEEKIKNHVSNTDRVRIGDETEIYIVELLKNTGLFLNVERIGYTGDKADIIVTLSNNIMKSIQVKTLYKIKDEVYSISNIIEYDPDMLIVMVNKERDRFALAFAKDLEAVSIRLLFTVPTSKYRDLMYTEKDIFLDELIEAIPLSTNYEGPDLYYKMEKEYNSTLRLEKRCTEAKLDFKKNETNANTIDCFINNIPIQLKYKSLSCEGRLIFNVVCSKHSGTLNGSRLRVPYSTDDLFKYFIIELGGTKDNPEKYHGYFCVIPISELINQGALKSSECKGKMSISICPPDYPKPHWSKKFWIGPKDKFILQ